MHAEVVCTVPRHVICDVDGCLVPPRGEMWDFAGLERLAEISRRKVVTLALCSGRPPAFMEAMARQLVLGTYCICENGAILMHPLSKVAITHPAIPRSYIKERPDILALLHKLIAGTPTVIEFGKEVMISVNCPDKEALGDLFAQVQERLQGYPVDVMNSGRSVEVVPVGITKDAGLAFWAELAQVPVGEVVSIGDADNDLDILRAAGKSAAPGNCTPAVRAVVDYVSPQPMVGGVLDIVNRVVQGEL
jgi:HAD superfamily hydrolase (TIGR01484 family)